MSTLGKTQIDPNIYFIDNFLSEEEMDAVLNQEIDWKLVRNDPHQNILTGVLINGAKDSFDPIEKKIRLLLDNDSQKYSYSPGISKYVPNEPCLIDGCGCGRQAFIFHFENNPDTPERWITSGFVIYLNDDFQGGELIFKNKPIEFKPKRGTIIVFPGTEEYSHGVKDVLGSARYAIVGFTYSNEYWESK